MLVLLLLVGGAVAYGTWASAETRRRREAYALAQEAERHRLETAQAKEALAKWTWSGWDQSVHTLIEVSFREMTYGVEIEAVGFNRCVHMYYLRRVDPTQWERKETDGSWRANIAKLDRERDAEPDEEMREALDEMSADERKPPEWRSIALDPHLPAIETAYQRHIHAGA